MRKILSAILAVMLLVGALAVPSSAALAPVKDPDTNMIDYKATVNQYLTAKNDLSNVFVTDTQKLEKMTLAYEKDGYQLWVDEYTGEVATYNVATDKVLFTNPIDIASSNAAHANSTKYELMSQIIVKYIDNGDPKTFTSFEQAAMNGQIDVVNIRNGLRVEYTIGREDTKYLVPRLIEKNRFVANILEPMVNNIIQDEGMTREGILGGTEYFTGKNLAFNMNADTDFGKYSRFAQFYTLQDPNDPTLSMKQLAEMQNNFPITKDMYNGELMAVCVCPDSTAPNDLFFLESLIKTYCPLYTFEQLEIDHEITKYTVTERPPALFKMALEYRLDELGLTVRLPANGIRFNEAEYQLENIAILPWMGAGSNEHTGYTFFPDGSGALFRFEDLNDGKNHTVNGSVYGQDFAYHNATELKHQEVIRYPVFGLVEDVPMNSLLIQDDTTDTTVSEGFVAILEEGDALAKIELKHYGGVSKYNSVYVLVNPRPKDEYVLSDAVSVGSNSSVTVLSKRKYVDDYKIRYIMLTDPRVAEASNLSTYYDASWMGMATAYRDYLASPYSTGTQNLPEDQQKTVLTKLTENDINTSGIPLYIETFGAVETVRKVLSIPVNTKIALTSFDDIQSMYTQLKDKGIENVNFKLTGYYNGGMDSTVPYKFKIENVVGGKDGFKDLLSDAKDRGYGVFVDFDFVYADMYASEWFDGLNNSRDLVKSIDDRYISKQYYSVTRQSYTSYFELAISASRFEYFYDKVSKEYLSYNPIGISLSTLASDLNSDFDEDEPYNREDTKDFTKSLFEKIQKDYSSVMADSANAYTWGYLDHMVDAAVDSSRYVLASNSVPFMGVVLHGYVQFAGTPMNMEGNIGYAMLKAIENGAGLYFILSYDNTEVLKEDIEFSQYYSVIYEIWFDELVERYNIVNGLLKDLQLDMIINHEFLIGERVPDPDEVIADKEAAEKLEQEKAEAEALALKLKVINAVADTRFSLLQKAREHSANVEAILEAYGSADIPGTQLYQLNEKFQNIDTALIASVVKARTQYNLAEMVYAMTVAQHGFRPTKEQLEEQAALSQIVDETKKVYDELMKDLRITQLNGVSTVTIDYVVNFKSYIATAEEYFETAQMAYDALILGKYPDIVNPADYEDSFKNQLINNYNEIKAIRDEICGTEETESVLQSKFDEYVNTYYYTIKELIPTANQLDSIINADDEEEELDDGYVYTKYTNDDGNIVAVTYGGKNGDASEAKVTFILNYNFFDVTVKYEDRDYTIEGFGFVKIEH